MPQQIRIVDTTSSYRPVDPDTVPPKLLSDSSLARGDEEPLFPYDGYNFIPTTYGYTSFFGESNTLQADSIPANQDCLFTFQNIEYNTIIVALGEDGIRIKWNTDASDTSWLHVTLPADPDIYQPWSFALLNNNLYLYRSFDPHFYVVYFDPAKALLHPDYDPSDTAWKYRPYKLTPSFINMDGQVGLFRAGIRLGFWDAANAVAVSSVDDVTDFTPSAATLSGVSTFSLVEGRITNILPFKDGFVIYAMANIVLVERDLSSALLWSSRVLFDRGVAYRRQIVSEKTYEVHYAITESCIIQIAGGKVDKIIPEIYELMQEAEYPYYLYLLDERYLCFLNIDSKQARRIRSTIDSSGGLSNNYAPEGPSGRPPITFPARPQDVHDSVRDYIYYDWVSSIQEALGMNYGDRFNTVTVIPSFNAGESLSSKKVADIPVDIPGVGEIYLNDLTERYSSLTSLRDYQQHVILNNPTYYLEDDAKLAVLKLTLFLNKQIACNQAIIDGVAGPFIEAAPSRCTKLIEMDYDVDNNPTRFNTIRLLEDCLHPNIDVLLYDDLVTSIGVPTTYFSENGIRVAAPVLEKKQLRVQGSVVYSPSTAPDIQVNAVMDNITEVVWEATTGWWGPSGSAVYDPDYISHIPVGNATGFMRQIMDKSWDAFAEWCGSVLPFDGNYDIIGHFPEALPIATTNLGTACLVEVSLFGSCAREGGANVVFSQLWKVKARVRGDCHPMYVSNKQGDLKYWHNAEIVEVPKALNATPEGIGGYIQVVSSTNGNTYPGVAPWSSDIAAAVSIPEILNTAVADPEALTTDSMISPGGQIGNTPYYANPIRFSNTCRQNLRWDYPYVPLPPYAVSIVQGSHEIPYPKYEGAYVYDTNLRKWGRQVGRSSAWFSLVPINRADPLRVEAHELVRQAGYLTTKGELTLFTNTPEQSEIVYGKIGLSRTGYTDAERIILHLKKSVSRGYERRLALVVEPSMDGRAPSGYSIEADYSGGNSVLLDMPIRASARWYNIVVRGWYDISYLEFRGSASGRR